MFLFAILGSFQILAIFLFAKDGYGYVYVFSCIALLHAYMYATVFKNIKDREKPTNLYSIVEGYLVIPAAVYGLPVVLAAQASLISTNSSMADLFVINNQEILSMLAHFKLTALPAHIDGSNLKNALYIYYLGLAAFSGIFSFILSLPFLWLMSKGWSDFFDANPKQFALLRIIGCSLFMAAACVWAVYTHYNAWVKGIALSSDGSLRFVSWQYNVAGWMIFGCYLTIMISGLVGSVFNAARHLLGKKPSP